MDLEGEIDRLYGLDRDAFVAERDAAARRLRAEGDREGADRLRAFRKPTVAAWALNRLARDRPREVADLLAGVEELGFAQAQAVKGDPGRFGEAAETHRAALEALVDAAQRILEEADSASAATVERVRETLHAVSVDPQARELLRTGRLDRERQPGGLDALGLAGVVPVEEVPARRASGAGDGGARAGQRPLKDAARKVAGPAEAAGAQRRRRQRAAREATGIERAQTEAAAAQEGAQRRRAAVREARDAVRAGERRAQSARRRAERAEAAAAKAESTREEARLALAEAERERDVAVRRELALREGG